jgi:hypothetical protein
MFAASQADGTSLDKQMSIREAMKASRKQKQVRRNGKDLMKPLSKKEFVSLALIAITAPVLALGLVLAIRTVAERNDVLLVAFTLCGAVVSGINGFGRRTVSAASSSRRSHGGPQSSVALTS